MNGISRFDGHGLGDEDKVLHREGAGLTAILTGLGAALTQYMIMHFQISEILEAVNQEISTMVDAADKSALIHRKYEFLNGNVIVGASGAGDAFTAGLLLGFQ